MEHRTIQEDSVDQQVTLRFLDSDGVGADVDHATSGLALWYRRDGAAKVTITPASLAALTTAHTDGGVEPIDDGYTRVDLPDLAVATGVQNVIVGGVATGLTCVGAHISLVPYNPYADLIGTPTDTDIATDIANLATSIGTPSDLGGGATLADNLADIEGQTDDIGVAGAGLTALATAAALTTVDTVVDAIKVVTDALTSAGAAKLALSADGIINGAAATGTLSTTQATSNLTGFGNDQLIGRTIVFTAGPADGEASAITDYAETGGLLTFDALTTAPENGDTFVIV